MAVRRSTILGARCQTLARMIVYIHTYLYLYIYIYIVRGTDSSRKHYVADQAARQVVADSQFTLTQLTLNPPYSCQG